METTNTNPNTNPMNTENSTPSTHGNIKQSILQLHDEGLTRGEIKQKLNEMYGQKERHAFIYKTLKQYLGEEFVLVKRGRPAKPQVVQLELQFEQ